MNIPISFKHIEAMPDRVLVPRIVQMRELETSEFFYGKAAPMFIKLHSRFRIGHESVLEFINDFYLYLMQYRESSECRKIETFGYRSLFITWIARVALNYCLDNLSDEREIVGIDEVADRDSASIDQLEYEDIMKIIELMPCAKYRMVIQLLYVDDVEPQEVARRLEVSMDNFYNIHRRARLQFVQVYNKEMKL